MNEIKYYISALYLSLFSRKFYYDLFKNRRIIGTKYLLLVSLIISFPFAYQVKALISETFASGEYTSDENIDHIFSQVPDIKIEKGRIKIVSDSNQNVFSKSGDLVAVFDAEKKINELNDYNSIAVVGDQGIRIKFPDDRGILLIPNHDIARALNKYFVDAEGGAKLDKQALASDLKVLVRTPLLPILIIFVGIYFIKYFVAAFIYSFIVGIMLSIIVKNVVFDLRACIRIAVFTSTLVAAIEGVTNVMGQTMFSNPSLVYFIIQMLYIHFAVESIQKLRD